MFGRFVTIAFIMSFLLSGCLGRGIFGSREDAAYQQVAGTVYADMTKNAPLIEGRLPLHPTDTTEAQVFPATQTVLLPTPAPSPSATPRPISTLSTPIPTPTPRLVYQDTFKAGGGWGDQGDSKFGFGFYQGGYRIYVNLPNTTIWSVKELALGDVFIDADASQLSGPSDGYFGATCRFQSGNNYYALVISADGSVGIGKMMAGKFEFLEQGQAQPGVIQAGNTVNHIHAECIGSRLSLFANGQKLLEAEDSDFSTGSTGILAGTRKNPGMAAFFENIAVSQP